MEQQGARYWGKALADALRGRGGDPTQGPALGERFCCSRCPWSWRWCWSRCSRWWTSSSFPSWVPAVAAVGLTESLLAIIHTRRHGIIPG